MNAILHLGAEVSPPHYDELFFWNWNLTIAVSDWLENNSRTLNHLLDILDQSWIPRSFWNVVSCFPEKHKQLGWMFVKEKLDSHVD